MGRRKKTGLDGRYAGELSLLPDKLLELLSVVLEAVEDAGAWPDVGPEGLLPPKPGGDDAGPMQRRPIWLLPVVYR
eukprot:54631-Lingulodinium_polyedra.AAC.1